MLKLQGGTSCISSATMGKRKSLGSNDASAKGQKSLKQSLRPATSPVCDKLTDWLLCSQ